MMFHFHNVAQVRYLREMDMFCVYVWNVLPAYTSAKIVKIERVFPELWSQTYVLLRFYGT